VNLVRNVPNFCCLHPGSSSERWVFADYNLQMYELEELLSGCNLKCLHVQFRLERAIIYAVLWGPITFGFTSQLTSKLRVSTVIIRIIIVLLLLLEKCELMKEDQLWDCSTGRLSQKKCREIISYHGRVSHTPFSFLAVSCNHWRLHSTLTLHPAKHIVKYIHTRAMRVMMRGFTSHGSNN
jgi:hypothetical protein